MGTGISPSSSDRPRAVFALGVVEIILGAFSFFGGFVHIFLGIGSIVTFSGANAPLGQLANALGTALVGFGVLFVVAGAAILGRARWARAFSWIVTLAGLIAGVVSLALGTVGAVPGLVLAVIALYLISRESVRTYFAQLNGRAARPLNG